MHYAICLPLSLSGKNLSKTGQAFFTEHDVE